MKPIIIEDGRTIVLARGYFSPHRYGTGRFGGFNQIQDGLLADPELLRQVVSTIMCPEERTLIPENDFYPECWEPEKYEADGPLGSIDAFFTTFRRIARHDMYCSTVEQGEWVMAYGTEQLTYRRMNRPLDDKHFRLKSIRLPDESDRALVKKCFEFRVAPAITHCLIVGRAFMREDKPMYKHFKKRTTSKVRDIWAPEPEVKAALRHLLHPLNSAYDMKRSGSPQYAYTKDRNILMNAEPHARNKWMLNADITGFFDHCDWDLVKGYMRFLMKDISAEDKAVLKVMLINPATGGLYQGSPVSGALSNAILRPAAKYMKAFFQKEGRTLTVYADDITVSQGAAIDSTVRKNIVGKIRHAFEKFDLPFDLKPSKTRVSRNNGRKVTGIRINHLDQCTIPLPKYRLLRSMLHRMSSGGDVTMAKSQLKGYLEFARFNDRSGKIDRLIDKYRDVLVDKGMIRPILDPQPVEIPEE